MKMERVVPIPVKRIEVLDFAERPASRVSDDLMRNSIKAGGIQQPLVIIKDGKRLILSKGLRRLRIARALRMTTVPCLVWQAPAGREPEDYARQLRFVLTDQRQDLVPTQKADLIIQLRERFRMNNRQVAAYLGIVPDSVTNWLAVRGYIEPVRTAMDSGQLTMQAARVFDGLTDQGQRAIWRAHRLALTAGTASTVHKALRAKYSPESFPQYYRDAKLVAARLKRVSGKRKSGARAQLGAAEKTRLLHSFEHKEAELREFRRQLGEFETAIGAAVGPIGAIMRNADLLAMVPTAMLPELERFAEVYI